ncbi:unnamed protein product [Allacma fusca]|uniref:Uncharacterized protein n=1 Tax=Allacma fusca TaxID=39272 RepID=A0A8J2LEJ8_9HEXA|nr:unnamed protein product [Allacma fusca]
MTKLAVLAVFAILVALATLAEPAKRGCKGVKDGAFISKPTCKRNESIRRTQNGRRVKCPCKCRRAKKPEVIGFYCPSKIY